MKKREILIILKSLTRYMLIFLFTYTGINKLIDHDVFYSSILQSPIIKNQAALISWLVPVFELLIVVMLVSRNYNHTGLLYSLLLLLMFTFYIAYMILFIPHLPCSCGGVLKKLSWNNHILFNSFLIIITFISLRSDNQHKLFIAINRSSRKPV